MKKFFALTIALSLLTTSIFAQETEEEVVVEPTIEERVAVLEEAAATSPITFSGDLEFAIGTTLNREDTDYPVASGTSTATATLGLSALDDKVTAEVTIDFMADPTVASTLDNLFDTNIDLADPYGDDEATELVSVQVQDYELLERYIDFWNDVCDDYTFTATHQSDILDRVDLSSVGATMGTASSGDLQIDILDYTDADPDSDEFIMTDAFTSNQVNVLAQIDLAMVDALDDIADSSDNFKTTDLPRIPNTTYANLVSFFDALNTSEIAALTDNDKDAFQEAFDLLSAYDQQVTLENWEQYEITSTVTKNYLTGAVISLNEIGGVLDLTMNFDSQHVSAGVFNLDSSGHEDSTIDDYPSFVASLSEDVVEGLSASVGFYINDEDADLDTYAGDDDWTWIDEAVDAEDPKLGLTVGAGYSISIGEEATLDIDADFGMYDLAGGDSLEWGFAVMPSFSGFNLNASVEFAYALDMIYLNVAADYTILEMITPAVEYTFLSGMTDDLTLAWDDDASSVVGNFQHGGGSLLEIDLDVDLSDLLPIGLTVDGGIDLYLVTDMEIAWDAGLSVTPFDNFVVSGAINGDAVADGDLAWNASVAYTYGIATLTGTVSQGYDSDDSADVISVGFTCSVSL